MNPYEEDLQARERELRNLGSSALEIPKATSYIPIEERVIPKATSYIPIEERVIPKATSYIPIEERVIPKATSRTPIEERVIPRALEELEQPLPDSEKYYLQYQSILNLLATGELNNPDKTARAMTVGDRLRVDPELVYKDMERWEALSRQMNPDVEGFLKDPRMFDLLVRKPVIMPTVPKVVGDGTWEHLKSYLSLQLAQHRVDVFKSRYGRTLERAAELGEESLTEIEKKIVKEYESLQEDATESKFYPKPRTVFVRKGDSTIWDELKVTRVESKRAALGVQAMAAAKLGNDPRPYIWEAERLRQEIQDVAPGEGILQDVVQAGWSTYYTASTGVKIGAPAMVAGALAGLALKRTPLGALAWAGATGKAGFGLGAFFGSFELEAGSTFLDLYGKRTPEGKFIDFDTAAGHAVMYGAVAGGVEVLSLRYVLDSLPFRKLSGEIMKARAEKVAVKPVWELLGSETYTEAFKKLGREYASGVAKSAAAEGTEESVQSALQYWATVSAMERAEEGSGYGGKYFSGAEMASAAADAFIPGAIGGGFLFSAGSSVNTALSLYSTHHRISQSQEVARVVAGLTGTGEKPGLRDVADVVSRPVVEIIREMLRINKNAASSHAYITATEFLKLAGEMDAEDLAVKLFGSQGLEMLHAGLRGEDNGYIKIRLEDYLQKLIMENPEIAKRLSEHTTLDPSYETHAQSKNHTKEEEAQIKKLVAETKANENSLVEKYLKTLEKDFEKLKKTAEAMAAEPTTDAIVQGIREYNEKTGFADYPVKDLVDLVRNWVVATSVKAGVSPDAVMAKFIPVVTELTSTEQEINAAGTFPIKYFPDWAQDFFKRLGITEVDAGTLLKNEDAIAKDQTLSLEQKAALIDRTAFLSLGEKGPTKKYSVEELQKMPLGLFSSQKAWRHLADRVHKIEINPLTLNLTAILHELAHSFFEARIALAADPNVGPAIRRENQALRTWLDSVVPKEKRQVLALWHQYPSGTIVEFSLDGKTLQGIVGTSFGQDYLRLIAEVDGVWRSDIKVPIKDVKTPPVPVEGAPLSSYETELVAVSAEEYFKTGVAPSPALAGVFSRFRKFLTTAYELTLRGAFVQPGTYSDKDAAQGYVSKLDSRFAMIMDRMLATDSEIQRMTYWRTSKPLFKTIDEFKKANLGGTDEDWARYLELAAAWYDKTTQLTERKILREAFEATKALTKSLEDQYLKDAAQEIKEQPTYRMWLFLSQGVRMVDGQVLDVVEPAPKIDAENFEAVFKDKLTPKEMAAFQPYLAKTGGLSWEAMMSHVFMGMQYPVGASDLAAGLESSGKNFVKAIAKAALDNFNANHPKLTEELRDLENIAGDSQHTEENTEWITHELKMLRPDAPETPRRLIRKAAKRVAYSLPLHFINTRELLRRERFASDNATAAAARGDVEAAFMWKQQQLLNSYVYEYAIKIRHDKGGFNALMKKMFTRDRREAAGKAGDIFLELLDSVAQFFGKSTNSPVVLNRVETLNKFFVELQARLLSDNLDKDVLRYVLAGDPREMDEINGTEMYALMDMMKVLWQVIRTDNKILVAGREQTIEDINIDIALDATAEPIHRTQALKDSGWEKWKWGTKVFFSGLAAARMDPELILERLGPTATRALWDRYIDSRNREIDLSKRFQSAWRKTYDAMPREMMDKRDAPVDTSMLPQEEKVVRDRKWLWMVLLNYGNELNIKRLTNGRGPGLRWSEAQLTAFFKANAVTDQEMQFAQDIWSMFEEQLWPEIKETYKRQFGIEPKPVKARSFEWNGKTYRGGYFPIRYMEDSAATLERKVRAIDSMRGYDTIFEQMPAFDTLYRGFTEERAQTGDGVLDLSWDVFSGHVMSVIHYVAFDAMLRDGYRLVNSPMFRDTVKRRLGPEYIQQIDSWLGAVATNNSEGVDAALHSFKGLLGWSRSSLMISTLGYNVGVAAGDLVGPLFAVAKGVEAGGIDIRYLFASYLGLSKNLGAAFDLREQYLSGESLRARAERLSKELEPRAIRFRHTLNRDLRKIAHEPRHLPFKVRAKVQEHAFFFMEFTDKYVSTMVWDAAFRRNLDLGMETDAAARDADARVRGILPTHVTAEMPAFLRSKRMIGSLLAFFSFFNKMHNSHKQIWHRAYQDWNRLTGGYDDDDNPAPGSAAWNKLVKTGNFANSTVRAAAHSLAAYAVTNVFGEFLAGRGKEDDEELWQWWTRKMLAAPAMNVPFAGQAIEIAVNQLVTGKRGKKVNIRVAPALALLEKTLDLTTRGQRISRDGGLSEAEVEDYIAAMEVVAAGAQLPTRQFVKTERYIRERRSGDLSSRGAGDLFGGLVYGEYKVPAQNLGRIWHDVSSSN